MGRKCTGRSPAQAEYSYEWRYSSDPFNLGPVQSTSSTCNVPMPCTEGEGIYVRLKVTSVDGQVSETGQYFIAAQDWTGIPSPCPIPIVNPGASNSLKPLSIDPEITIYPNPSSGQVSFISESGWECRIFNQYGKMVLHLVDEEHIGNRTRMADLTDQSPGVYFFEFRNGSQTIVRKVLKF